MLALTNIQASLLIQINKKFPFHVPHLSTEKFKTASLPLPHFKRNLFWETYIGSYVR